MCRFLDLFLLWLCLLVRVTWLARFPVDPIGPVDAEGFHLLAVNVLAGRGFAIGWEPPFCPTGVRTPLYPLLLMGGYSVLGAAPARAVLVHLLLAVLTTAWVMRLGREVGGAPVGRLAGALYALNGTTQRYIGYLLAEALLLPLMAMALWATVRALRRPTPGRCTLAGLVWGLALLTKPNVQFLALAVGVLLSVGAWFGRRAACVHRPGAPVAFWLALLAVLLPWLARNRVAFGRWMLSTAFETNLARVSAVATLAEVERVPADPWTETWEHLYERLVTQAAVRYGWPEGATLASLSCEARARRRWQVAQVARDLVMRHPRAWLASHAWGVTLSLLDPGHRVGYAALTGRPWQATGRVANVWVRVAWSLERGAVGDALRAFWQERVGRLPLGAALLWWGLLLGRIAVGAWGLRGLWRLRNQPLVALTLAGTVAYIVVLPGPIAYDRFYLPAIPGVVVLVAMGLVGPRQAAGVPGGGSA